MDWDSRYRNGDTPWNKGYETPALHEIKDRYPLSGEIWVPGAGIGHDARYIANTFPDTHVTAFDISETALSQAIEFNLPENLTFEIADIFKLDKDRKCDIWFEHTCFCAIDPSLRNAYRQATLSHIKKDGLFTGVFFVGQDFDSKDGPPFFSTEREIEDLFGDNFRILDKWMPSKCYPGREGEEMIYVFQKDRP
ncbi:MAG: methyltransferase domain-containing protein [Opitutales bacterium]